MKKIIFALLSILCTLTSCGSIKEYTFEQSISTLEACETYDLNKCVKLQDGFTYEITEDNIDINHIGTYPVTFVITDDEGHSDTKIFDFEVKDTTRPTLTCDNTIQVDQDSDFNLLDYVSAYDSYDGDLTNIIEYDHSSYDIHAPGTYSIDLSVYDSSGNAMLKSIRLNVMKVITPRENTVIRNVCWGDDIKTIKNNEETDPVFDEPFDFDTESGHFLQYSDIYVAGLDSELVYYINPDYGLYSCMYVFDDGLFASDKHFTDYETILSALVDKYGPAEKTTRRDNSTGLKKSSALWLGRIYYADEWTIDNTIILMQLGSIGSGDILLNVVYTNLDVDPTNVSNNL